MQWLSPYRRRAIDVDDAEWGRVTRAPQATPPRRRGASAKASSTRSSDWASSSTPRAAGRDARVQVNFRDTGVKWLALEYAKLEPA